MKEKIQNGLDEARILVLSVEVLAGFAFHSVFETGFTELPQHAQWMKIGSLWLMLMALALLTSPAAYHQIVERGETSRSFHRFISLAIAPALLPLAFGLGIDFYVALIHIDGQALAAAVGIIVALTAMGFWYGLEHYIRWRRRKRGESRPMMTEEEKEEADKPTPLAERIQLVMTELRVVLPGAQALVGFQFMATLTEAFEKLPSGLKVVHMVSLGLVALSVIFLMAPAAFHRIVEDGHDSEAVHHFSAVMVLASMAVLAPGVCGDLFIVCAMVFGSLHLAAAIALVTLGIFYGFWFGYMFYARARKRAARPQAGVSEARAA